MDWANVGLVQGMFVGVVDTGSSVAAITERVNGAVYVRARVLKASKGPKVSSAWNPG